jgi:hypothetical protein
MKMGEHGVTGNKFSSMRLKCNRLRVIYERGLSNIVTSFKMENQSRILLGLILDLEGASGHSKYKVAVD